MSPDAIVRLSSPSPFLPTASSTLCSVPTNSAVRERSDDMPTIQSKGATIYYEEVGQGFPILTFAPAGLMSVADVWNRPMSPVNPMTEWGGEYRVIAMDQRNAGGKSHAPITAQDGWHSFLADHIA